MPRLSIDKGFAVHFQDAYGGKGSAGQIKKATLLGRSYSLTLPDGTKKVLNRGSFIDFLNSKNKDLPPLKKGWFFGYFGSSDAEIEKVFNALFDHTLKDAEDEKNEILNILNNEFKNLESVINKKPHLAKDPYFILEALNIAAVKDKNSNDRPNARLVFELADNKALMKDAEFMHKIISMYSDSCKLLIDKFVLKGDRSPDSIIEGMNFCPLIKENIDKGLYPRYELYNLSNYLINFRENFTVDLLEDVEFSIRAIKIAPNDVIKMFCEFKQESNNSDFIITALDLLKSDPPNGLYKSLVEEYREGICNRISNNLLEDIEFLNKVSKLAPEGNTKTLPIVKKTT